MGCTSFAGAQSACWRPRVSARRFVADWVVVRHDQRMFGRKKDKGGGDTSGELTDDNEENDAEFEQQIAEQAAMTGAITVEQQLTEANALAETGTRARATITAVELVKQFEEGATWRAGMSVQVSATDAFDAELRVLDPIFYKGDPAPWTVGDVTPVVFDPQDRSKVRLLPRGALAAVRWRVPTQCPHCGAPVDQAVESLLDQPMCRFCNQPLPAEPLG